MDINIRENIIKNFNDTNEQEIMASIESSVAEKKEILLPGLGVFFEILWDSSDDKLKNIIVRELVENIKK